MNDGNLRSISDDKLISMAKDKKVVPVMVITNIGEEGRFSSNLAHQILINETIQNKLITNVFSTMYKKGYSGLDVDFEYVPPEDRDLYINFLRKVRREINRRNSFLVVAVAPKYSDDQKGVLYEAHDYKRIGELADHVIIMTYEWGYSGGEARAVSPLNLVQRVLDYAVTRIPPSKILMGIPNYGYDWTLPFTTGSLATSIGNYEAVNIARSNNQSIKYDPVAQAPYFNYTDAKGAKHIVWFEDARSIQAKLGLVTKYNLEGISYWTLNRFFPQNYLVLNSLFKINKYL
jgi:spore germination protein